MWKNWKQTFDFIFVSKKLFFVISKNLSVQKKFLSLQNQISSSQSFLILTPHLRLLRRKRRLWRNDVDADVISDVTFKWNFVSLTRRSIKINNVSKFSTVIPSEAQIGLHFAVQTYELSFDYKLPINASSHLVQMAEWNDQLLYTDSAMSENMDLAEALQSFNTNVWFQLEWGRVIQRYCQLLSFH